MKHTFVLDENVMILAQKRQDLFGQPDETCFKVMASVIGNCHCLAITWKVWELYLKQLNALGRDALVEPRVLSLLASAATNPQKVFLLDEAPEFDSETGLSIVDEDDLHFVRLAVAAQAILVTTDSGLTGLDQQEKVKRHSCHIVPPKQALRWALETDP